MIKKSEIPEYELLFSTDGSISVEVKQKGVGVLPVRKKAMSIRDVHKLMLPDESGFIDRITVDEYSFVIDRIEIQPASNKLTIWVTAGA